MKEAEERVQAQEMSLVDSWTIEKNIEFKRLQALYIQAITQEEIFWKEKSRDKWIKEGDKNTSYFYAKVNAHIIKPSRTLLLENREDTWTDDPNTIHNEVVNYF